MQKVQHVQQFQQSQQMQQAPLNAHQLTQWFHRNKMLCLKTAKKCNAKSQKVQKHASNSN
jgi:hypothetical protein